MNNRIYLSPPHLAGDEYDLLEKVLDSNWIAPVGPQLEAFEQEFAEVVGARFACALSSGTAALHLALLAAGVQAGDEVLVSTLTFAGSVFPIAYLDAKPVFVDSAPDSWNMDPDLLADILREKARKNRLPAALIVVHLYGQCADMQPILSLCEQYDIPVIEDAAEALGARYRGQHAGTFGQSAIFSFNGNKIITTSGGGMLVSNEPEIITYARKMASQAREPEVHYEHSVIGYNYRMSNVLAALGRAQLRTLSERVERRRTVFDNYAAHMAQIPGIRFMPEPAWSYHSRWLTTLTLDMELFGCDRESVRKALEEENIESRPVWKPMHLQPVFAGCEAHSTGVAERLFAAGLCLPSGCTLTCTEQEKIAHTIGRLVPYCV